MARYVTRVKTPLAANAAFDYVADLTNFAEWDPGVGRSVQVEGDGAGLGAAYDVTVGAVPRDLTLRYEVVEHDPPRTCLVVARSTVFTSTDRITVVPDGDGSIVTYDAELALNGPLGLFDPVLRLAFGRIGDRAAAGLRRALDGTAVPA